MKDVTNCFDIKGRPQWSDYKAEVHVILMTSSPKVGTNSNKGISTSFNLSQVVKYLVENGADIHKPNINGGTCLINSVQSVDLCKFLIEKNADVNAQDNSGMSQVFFLYSGPMFS